MSRAGARSISLPDALSSRRKPGPAARSLEGYRELSAVLRSKELISQWSISSGSDGVSDLQLREALTRTLGDHCHFGYIRAGSKLPHSHPRNPKKLSISTESGSTDFLRANGTDWLGITTAPVSGNWSVIPRTGSRLFIFDLDVSKAQILEDGSEIPTTEETRYLEARRAIGHLETLLGIDLKGTYAQLSPSGGVHIFVLLPEGTDPTTLPAAKISDGMRALAGIPRESWSDELRGDIRSGASNGFLLMAGSRLSGLDSTSSVAPYYRPLISDPRWSDFKDYRSARKLRLLELPPAAVERLQEARSIDLELRALARPLAVAAAPRDQIDPVELPRISRELRPGSYSRLLKRLEDEPPRSFHEARAQIYRALSCCGSPESIAALCKDAGYGRDSHSNRELSDGELLADMESMERRGLRATRCGSHCGSARLDAVEPGERQLELASLTEALQTAKLNANAELSALGFRRVGESSLLEARAALRLRAQRSSDYGIYGKRNPLGLNYSAVTREILGERAFRGRLAGRDTPIAGYRLRALELSVGYFGPLFAAGASVAIAPASELMELFGWSRSQLREALRFLRSSEIISLERRQVSGRASGYGPGAKRFFDAVLGKKLKSTWGASLAVSVSGERAFLGGFFDHSRGRIVRPNGTSYTDGYLREVGGGFSGLLQELSLELPLSKRVAPSVVSRYLTKSLAHYLEVSTEGSAAEAKLHELKEAEATQPSTAPLRGYFAAAEDLWMSGRAFREHSPADIPRARRIRRSRPGSHGDRSPPDDPDSPEQLNTIY